MLNSIPPHFRATITGRTLEITSGTLDARVIVRNSSNVQVLDRQLIGGTIEQIPTPGSYSLEIQSGLLTLVGAFVAQKIFTLSSDFHETF